MWIPYSVATSVPTTQPDASHLTFQSEHAAVLQPLSPFTALLSVAPSFLPLVLTRDPSVFVQASWQLSHVHHPWSWSKLVPKSLRRISPSPTTVPLKHCGKITSWRGRQSFMHLLWWLRRSVSFITHEEYGICTIFPSNIQIKHSCKRIWMGHYGPNAKPHRRFSSMCHHCVIYMHSVAFTPVRCRWLMIC